MNFTAAVHQLVPQSEPPQQQTAAALYHSSPAVKLVTGEQTKCLGDIEGYAE